MGPSLHLEVSRKADVWPARRYPILLRLACHTDARPLSLREADRLCGANCACACGLHNSWAWSCQCQCQDTLTQLIVSLHLILLSTCLTILDTCIYTVDAALMSIIGGRGFYVPCFVNNAKPQQLCKFHYKLRQILNNRTGTH